MNESPNNPKSQPPTGSRWVRRLLFGLACLATLIALFYAEENIRGKLAWNAYVREVEARGESLDPAKLIPPPVPDDQNFTLCPLLKPLFDFEAMAVWKDTNGLARLDAFNLHSSIENQLQALPEGENRDALTERARSLEASLPLSNGWVNLKGYEDYLRLGTNLNGVTLTDSAASNVLVALQPFDAGLDELKSCSNRRPLDRWPIYYDTNNPPAILLPHLARLKQFCQLLQLRAAANLAAGKEADAVEDMELALRLGESVRNEPILISQLVRAASHHSSMQPVKEGLSRHQLTESQLLELQRLFAASDLLAGAARALRGERSFFGVAVGELVRRKPGYLAEVCGSEGPETTLLYLIPGGWFYQNQLVTCRFQERCGLAPIDVTNRLVNPHDANEAQAALERLRAPFGTLARMVVPALRNALIGLAEGQTLMDQAVIACALERYYRANGRYPETLAALSPRFLDQIPHDVITGGPMIYRVLPDGRYLLYSVGWEGNDDGGAMPKQKDRYDPKGNEDWVWLLPDPKLQPY